MKKITLISFLSILIITSCNKYDHLKSDVSDNLYLYGRLYLQDSINDNGSAKPILAETMVKLSYKSDISNILYTTKTNTDGYFTFLNLTKDSTYSILAETTTGSGDNKLIFSVNYDVMMDKSQKNVTPVLFLDNNKQNGVLFRIKEKASLGAISGCNTCFFSSRQLWLKDTCDYGLFSSIPSNTNGYVIKTNLFPGTYYLLFKKNIGTSVLKSTDSINVSSSGISKKDILLN